MLGVVFVGPRIAEIREHAVAYILCDEPACFVDLCRTAAVILVEDLTQIFGIELSRESSRSNKVDEHDRELATFGRSRCSAEGVRCWRRPLRKELELLAAVATELRVGSIE